MTSYLFILLLLSSVPFQDPDNRSVELLTTGPTHGSDLSGKTEGRWFGLFETPTGFEIRSTNVSFRDVEVDGEHSHSVVSTDRREEALFLVREIPQLKEGPVKTSYHGRQFVQPGQEFYFTLFGKRPYALVASGQKDGEGIRDYQVTIFHDQKKHLLFSLKAIHLEVIYPTILWIGDIDRDSKPDMYVELHSLRHALFLSSFAKEGEFLREVAIFQRMGC